MQLLDAIGVSDDEATCVAAAAATLTCAAAGGPRGGGDEKSFDHQFAYQNGDLELNLSPIEENPFGSAAICIELERMLSPHVKFGPSIDSAMKSLPADRSMYRRSSLGAETHTPDGQLPGTFPSFAEHMREAGEALPEEGAGADVEDWQASPDAAAVQQWLEPEQCAETMEAAKLAARERIDASLCSLFDPELIDATHAEQQAQQGGLEGCPPTLHAYPSDLSEQAANLAADSGFDSFPVGGPENLGDSTAGRGDTGSEAFAALHYGSVPEGSRVQAAVPVRVRSQGRGRYRRKTKADPAFHPGRAALQLKTG